MLEQLDLFGRPDPNRVSQKENSCLDTREVQEALAGFPRLYLGTSSWAFPGWEGLVFEGEYKQPDLAKDGLRAYSKLALFRTVSLDRTYYRPMTEPEYRALASQVPEDFRFVVKAPRELLRQALASGTTTSFYQSFLEPTQRGLSSKLGVVLLQFPPGIGADFGSSFLGALSQFVRSLPKEIPFSLELRDEHLWGAKLSEALHGSQVSVCPSIHPKLPCPTQQLLTVPPRPDTALVFRWNLRPSLSFEDARNKFAPFSKLSLPDTKRREVLVNLVSRALEAGRSVYVTANNKAEGCSPLTLLRFLEELSSRKK